MSCMRLSGAAASQQTKLLIPSVSFPSSRYLPLW